MRNDDDNLGKGNSQKVKVDKSLLLLLLGEAALALEYFAKKVKANGEEE